MRWSINFSSLIQSTETEWVEVSEDDEDDDGEEGDSDEEGNSDDESGESDDDEHHSEVSLFKKNKKILSSYFFKYTCLLFDLQARENGGASTQIGDAVAIIKGEGKILRRKEKRLRIEQIRANLGLSDSQRTPLVYFSSSSSS